MNVNKMFGNNTASTRIYVLPTRITKVKSFCVYLKRCIIINKIPHIRLITTSVNQDMVLCLDSWTIEADDTDDIIKQIELKFDPIKFKIFRDDLTTLICTTRGHHGITMEYVIYPGNADVTPRTEAQFPDVNINDNLVSKATLYGPTYRRDNSNVYTILR